MPTSQRIRRTLLPAVAALIGLGGTMANAEPVRVFIGTYTGGPSKGIYRFDLDTATGKAGAPTLAAEITSPSFLAFGPGFKNLFAVNEVDRVGGKRGGGVTSYAVGTDGDLRLVNTESTVGSGPCHLVVDRGGRNVLIANYGGGSTAVVPVGDGGKLGPASGFVQHTGSSVNPQRQKEPHAHGIYLDPSQKFALVPDLGLDRVLVFKFDAGKGTITPVEASAGKLAPGAGPRHLAFHPNGRFVYVINELNSTVTAFRFHPDTGALDEIQTASTLPADFRGTNYPAEVAVHPNGRFLYGSNRGHNSLAVFQVDPETGKITASGHQTEGIKNPRNFAIDPTGNLLLSASQDADTVIVFKIDPNTGALVPTGHVVKVPKPVCVEFLPAGGR